jgi:hypothetical protein
MGAIIQTLTLATILLIIGLSCTAIGVVGLMWKTARDRRQIENEEKIVTSKKIADSASRQAATSERSLNS